RRRGVDELRGEQCRCRSPGWHLCWPPPQGREASRPAGPAGGESRADHQSDHRQGPRPYNPAAAARPRRRGDRVKRREFITLLGGAAASWPLVAGAQDNIARLGVLGPPRDSAAARFAYPVLLEELRKLGFAESRNLIIEFRRIDEGVPKAFAGANELIAAKANVLLAFGPELRGDSIRATI